ncbi:antibiotic biosynthesis monooxygenase [cyanobacterium TDX16]|nr:antibiotic biosynthesis monooxygenase [cyanobacterium TDX16]
MIETTIQQRQGQIYRIDKFKVPKPTRHEFIQGVQLTHQLLRTRQGFIKDFVFEQISGVGEFNFVTVVVWESADALEAAKLAVRAQHEEIGFNPKEMLDRLGIEADLANYSQIEI